MSSDVKSTLVPELNNLNIYQLPLRFHSAITRGFRDKHCQIWVICLITCDGYVNCNKHILHRHVYISNLITLCVSNASQKSISSQ